jgi:hypothetical protein
MAAAMAHSTSTAPPAYRWGPADSATQIWRVAGACHPSGSARHPLGSCTTRTFDGHHTCRYVLACFTTVQQVKACLAAPARTREQLAGAQVRVQRPDDAEGDAHAQQQRAPQVVLAARVAVQQLLPLLQGIGGWCVTSRAYLTKRASQLKSAQA